MALGYKSEHPPWRTLYDDYTLCLVQQRDRWIIAKWNYTLQVRVPRADCRWEDLAVPLHGESLRAYDPSNRLTLLRCEARCG